MAQPTQEEEEVKRKILELLARSHPLKALDIARGIGSDKKTVNRVLHNFMRTEAEKKSPPGQNPPLWGLVGQSPASSSTPSRASSSPGAVPSSSPGAASSSSRGTVPSSSPRLSASGGPEVYTRSESVDGSITFTPVSGHTSSTKISPQSSSASATSFPQEGPPSESLATGIAETSCDSTVKLQPTNHTSVGAVNNPLPSKQEKKKKPKRRIAASFGATEDNSRHLPEEESSHISHNCRHISQETESADDTHVGQEGEPPDVEHVTQEHVTQEHLSEEMSTLSFDPAVECSD